MTKMTNGDFQRLYFEQLSQQLARLQAMQEEHAARTSANLQSLELSVRDLKTRNKMVAAVIGFCAALIPTIAAYALKIHG